MIVIFLYDYVLWYTVHRRCQTMPRKDRQSSYPRSYEALVLRYLVTRFLCQTQRQSFRRVSFFSSIYRQIFFLLRMLCMRYNGDIHTDTTTPKIQAIRILSGSEGIDFQDYRHWFILLDERPDLLSLLLVIAVVSLRRAQMLLWFHWNVRYWKTL